MQIAGLVNPHAAFAAKLVGVPIVWQLLDTRAPRLVAGTAMALVSAMADVVMSTGRIVAEAHPGYSTIAARLIPYFPPVDLIALQTPDGTRAAVRDEWGIPRESLVVGCVANINPQKGIVNLVRSFAALRAVRPDAKLILVGSEHATQQDYATSVRSQIHLDGLEAGHDVVFTGGRGDVERQLAGIDIFALAAEPRSEGISTVVLEAMGAGLPVVATDVGGLREAIQHGLTGFLCPAGDIVAFQRALLRLGEDAALRARMGRLARHRAEDLFGLENCVEAHLEAYVRAMDARRPA